MRHKFMCLWLLITIMAWGMPVHVFAAQPDNPIVGQIKNRYGKMKSFSANFEQTLSHKESGGVEKRKGSLVFQKPMQIRWQTRKPHEETLIATSKEIWDYIPDEEIAYRYSPELIQDSRSIIQVVTGQSALSKDFDIKYGGMDKGLQKLTLYPHEPSPSMVEATIWVEPGTGLIRVAKVIDFYGNGNEVRFTSFAPDAEIKSSDFGFTPPKGIEIEDRMDKKIMEKELFK